jgi:hypothetical protein
MTSFKVYFRVALFNDCYFGEDPELLQNQEDLLNKIITETWTFSKYLCTESQSSNVIEYFKSIHGSNYHIIIDKLKFIKELGFFKCIVRHEPDYASSDYYDNDTSSDDIRSNIVLPTNDHILFPTNNDIKNILLPENIGLGAYLSIDSKYYLPFVEVDDVSILYKEDEELYDEEDEQRIYNGVYYHDSMDMLYQMEEDFRRRKLNEPTMMYNIKTLQQFDGETLDEYEKRIDYLFRDTIKSKFI